MINKENTNGVKKNKKFDAGKVFTKVMAGLLAVLMIGSIAATLMVNIIQG